MLRERVHANKSSVSLTWRLIQNSNILVDSLGISFLVPTPAVASSYFGSCHFVNLVLLEKVLVSQEL